MNTTGLVMNVTDELIEQLDALTCIDEGGAVLIHTDQVRFLLAELRRLRAEKVELERVVKDVRWRVADTTDQLQAYGFNGDRLYGLDEWSVPIRNLNIAIGMLEKATQ